MEQSKIHHVTSQDYYGRANLVKALPHVHLDIFCFFVCSILDLLLIHKICDAFAYVQSDFLVLRNQGGRAKGLFRRALGVKT